MHRAVWYGINDNVNEGFVNYRQMTGGLRRVGSAEAIIPYGANWTSHIISYILNVDSGNNIQAQMSATVGNVNQGTLWAYLEDTARVRKFKAGKNITKNKKVVHKGV